MRRSIRAALVRALVVVLLACVGAGGALGSWMQLAQGPASHVCRCSIEHHDCACALCHTDDPSLVTSSESIHGNCGTRAELLAPTAAKAVVFAPVSDVPIAGLLGHQTFHDPAPLRDGTGVPPPTPPPRVS